jgi:hypothetical protein
LNNAFFKDYHDEPRTICVEEPTNFSSQRRGVLTAILGVIGAAALAGLTAFATGLGTKINDWLFNRNRQRPAFSLQSPVVGSSLTLVVEPANGPARDRRALGVRLRGINIPNAGVLDSQATDLRWRVDLSKIPNIRDVLKEGADFQLQFFFDPDQPSDEVTIRFVGNTPQSPPSGTVTEIHAQTAKELLNRSQSNTKVLVDFSEEIISRAFPSQSPNVSWSSVHDGKEVTLSGLTNLEFFGSGARILAEPRYAWVINFRDCHSIALRNLVFGHTEAGYCEGGVLRFESCSDLILERCELFGSGTYGLEFVNCKNVELVGVTVHQCTCGIANLLGIENLNARDCIFRENAGFELFDFSKYAKSAVLTRCKFLRNKSQGRMFHFDEAMYPIDFYVNDSEFSENSYTELTNQPSTIATNNNKFTNNKITKSP